MGLIYRECETLKVTGGERPYTPQGAVSHFGYLSFDYSLYLHHSNLLLDKVKD